MLPRASSTVGAVKPESYRGRRFPLRETGWNRLCRTTGLPYRKLAMDQARRLPALP